MDEGTKQRLLTGSLSACEQHAGVQLFHLVGAVVGQRVALEIRPPIFVGVEFRSVARQVFQMESSAPPQPLTQHPTSMSRQPVPDHDDRPGQVLQQIAKEVDDLILPDGLVHVEVEIPAQAPTARRDRQSADGRDVAMVTSPLPHDRGLPAKRPSSADQRSRQKARFVNENEMGLPSHCQAFDSRPVLLDPLGDSLFVAFDRLAFWLLRGKNPARPSAVEWHRRGNGRGSVVRSTGRCEGRSTNRSRSQRPRLPSAGSQQEIVSVWQSTWTGGQAPGRQPRRGPRHAGSPSATDRRPAGSSSASERSGPGRGPAGSSPRPVAVAAPVAQGFHVVSWFIRSATIVCELYFYRTQ